MLNRVLITGASRGIGAATARVFAERGYDLVLACCRSMDRMKRLAEELQRTYGVNCETVQCDVSDQEAVASLFQEYRDIDILINNAAVSYIGLLTDMTVSDWKQVIDTNLNAVFYTCREVIPGMVSRKNGKIINVSSVWGDVGASMEVAYSTAKGGVNAFTKALAKELAPSHIQVNAAAFGVIDTEMNACFSEEEKRALIEEIPTDRFGSAEEAARMILSIAESPEYLTGQIITMDGGWI